MNIKTPKHRTSGFSLVELLMTITIVGVMGSIAVASLGDQTESVTDSRDRRNAQELAAASATAHAVGVDVVAGGQVEDAVRLIIQGVVPTTGTFKNRVFKVNLIGEPEVAGAMRFLRIQGGELVYHHDA